MNSETVKSAVLREQYQVFDHPSGLRIYVCEKPLFSTSYALFSTRYGSIDTTFRTQADPDFAKVPEGIAHFLEHKLFESEQGDAFERYAKTGASANAYTSFDKTAYLFSCADRFEDNLEILLDFVTHPYFTPQTVQKEQGIIGQEIRMYEDNPGWRVFFNLMAGLYAEHPVRLDIAGTSETIAEIDADLLYRCYHTFYNLSNMVLTVCGNTTAQTVLEVADRVLKPGEPVKIETRFPQEPRQAGKPYVEQRLAVSVPLFHIGYKEQPDTPETAAFGDAAGEVLCELVAGEASPLYKKLYDASLINASFEYERMSGRGFAALFFAGESRDPKKVKEEIDREAARLAKEGVSREDFERARKKVYGRFLRRFNTPDGIASSLLGSHFSGISLFDQAEGIASLGYEDVCALMGEKFNPEHSCLSVILPMEKQ